MAGETSTAAAQTGTDHRAVLADLEEQLGRTPKASKPYEHATIAYRLGLAHAEAPFGDPRDNLRKALAYYDIAVGIFDRRYDPVEHARVLNAAGAAHRALGDRRRAAALFEEASRLLEGRGRDSERAASLNNVGLVRSELGEIEPAIEAFDVAVDLFDATSSEGRRGRVAVLHNRGMAKAARGTEEGYEAALADYERARAELDPDDAVYHLGLVNHSIGIACASLAALRPAERERLLDEAVHAYSLSLQTFTRSGFPFQHALAKHNLGLAQAALGGEDNLRRALAAFDDAVGVLDPRLHADAWRQAYGSLERVEKELEAIAPGLSRADHFAALLAADEADRLDLVAERLLRLLALPEPRRPLTELSLAVAKLEWEPTRAIIEAELTILMELPVENQETVLQALYDAHQQLPEEDRDRADRALDQAIGDALGGPQRIFVRDFLYALGWERP